MYLSSPHHHLLLHSMVYAFANQSEAHLHPAVSSLAASEQICNFTYTAGKALMLLPRALSPLVCWHPCAVVALQFGHMCIASL